MIALLSTLLGASAALAFALHRHLRQLDAQRRTTAGDFTFDRYDGLGEFKIDVYEEPGHTCPACLGPCRNILQYASRARSQRWYYCGRCTPATMLTSN